MTEDELATIEARANAWKRPCFMCFGMAKTVPTWSACAKCYAAHCGMHERCGDCGSNAPPIEYAPDVVALVAEVRRLTAERDAAFNRGVDAMREAAVRRLTAERDAAFNRGVDAMREAAVQHFKQRAEGIEHAAARIACIAPTAAVCATLDEARRVADVAAEIRALKVAP